MRGKIPFFLLTFLFTVITGVFTVNKNCYASLKMSYGTALYTSYPLHFATPFHLYVEYGYSIHADSCQIKVTLPENLTLLSGNTIWRGSMNGKHLDSLDLEIQINQPGIYHISTEFDMYNVSDPQLVTRLPLCSDIYFYAREDTIAKFRDFNVLQTSIQDSLIYPDSVLWQREFNRRHSELIREFGVDSVNYPKPFYLDCYGLYRSLHLIDYTQIPTIYTPSQDSLIRKWLLLFEPPVLSAFDSFVTDTLRWERFKPFPTVNKDSLVNLAKTCISEIWIFDQQIIAADIDTVRGYKFFQRSQIREKFIKDFARIQTSALNIVYPERIR